MPMTLTNENHTDEIEQLRTEKNALEQEVQLLRMVLNNLPDTVYVKDTECKFLLTNEALVRMTGVESQDDLLGKDDFEFFPADLAQKYYDDEQEFFHSGQKMLTLEQPRLDVTSGRKGWILTSKIVFHNSRGEPAGLIGIGRDITDLKQAQEALSEQLSVNQSQREVLEELSTPIIPITDHIIIMPLIGAIDTARARNIMRSLLAGITEHSAHIIILDITGVPLVDTGVADHLNRTIQAARLKGAETIVTGISDAVAETIVDLGIDWADLDTVHDLQSGLKIALRRLRERLSEE
jgi:rsbT co-antagonist protein RsbR